MREGAQRTFGQLSLLGRGGGGEDQAASQGVFPEARELGSCFMEGGMSANEFTPARLYQTQNNPSEVKQVTSGMNLAYWCCRY